MKPQPVGKFAKRSLALLMLPLLLLLFEAAPSLAAAKSGNRGQITGRVSAKTQPLRKRPVQSALPNGILIRTPDKKVYLVIGGKKQLLARPRDIRQYRGGKIKDIGFAELAKLPDQTAMGYRNGTLLRGPDKTVYIILGGKKQAVSQADLRSYVGRVIIDVSQSVLNKY